MFCTKIISITRQTNTTIMTINNNTFGTFLQKKLTLILLFIMTIGTISISTIQAQGNWNDPGATVLLGGNTTGYNSSLLEVDGKPAIAYCDPLNNYVVKYRRATDSKGTTWGSSVTIDVANFSGYYDVDMKIINGNPAIVSSSAHNYDIRFTRASDAAGVFWNSSVVVAPNVTTTTTQRYFDLEEVNGKPAIAYYDSDDRDLYYVQATDANGNFWGTPVLIASTGNVGQHLSLAIINGRPAISYYDATNQDLMYVRATNANGTAWGTPMTLFSTNDVGLHTSLKSINGNPAIIFSDFTNKRLIYIRATDTDGTTWGGPTLVTTHYGEEMEMLVVDGQPAIAYYTGYGDHDLRYLRSQDANGTSWGTHEVLDDGSAAMGNRLSMAIIDGNPAISYQDFTNKDLKYIRADNPGGLPVELTFFKGKLTEQGSELTWQTASEKNNEGFEIERSQDGENWETLDFVQGYGTTTETENYNYTDYERLQGTSYYRLKQIDFDEKYEYSHVIQITREQQSGGVKIYPTLVQNDLNIESGKGDVTIYNTLGQHIMNIQLNNQNTTISLSHLPKGQYFLRFQNEVSVSTLSFIKTN